MWVWKYLVGIDWFFASSVIMRPMHWSQGPLPWPSSCSTEEIIIDKRYWVSANISQLQLFSAKLSFSTVFSRILYTRLQALKVGNCWWCIVDGTSEVAKKQMFSVKCVILFNYLIPGINLMTSAQTVFYCSRTIL